jgi:SAM-dependent methyltransferase
LKTADVMRRDWDDRAQRNALFYIEDSRRDWNADSFFQSGEDDFNMLVAPVLNQIGFDPAGKSVLELGCGAGRMSRSFAARFRSVVAVDISSEMLKQGQQLTPDASNIVWLQGNGLDLADVPSESVDLVFSYLVLQHLPTEQVVSKYVSEIVRVIRPGGAFLFQFNSLTTPKMNLRGRVAWAVVDAFWSLGFVRFSRTMARAFGFDPLTAGRSWRGATVALGRMSSFVHSSGGTVLGTKNEDTSAAWCYGTKIAPVHSTSSD